jgi:hypothetical protein
MLSFGFLEKKQGSTGTKDYLFEGQLMNSQTSQIFAVNILNYMSLVRNSRGLRL